MNRNRARVAKSLLAASAALEARARRHAPQRVLVARALLKAADALEAVTRHRENDDEEDGGPHRTSMIEEPPVDEPDEDDLTTTDHSEFYQGGRLAFTVDPNASKSQMWSAIEKHAARKNFSPNVWFISDHGNAHQMTNPKHRR